VPKPEEGERFLAELRGLKEKIANGRD